MQYEIIGDNMQSVVFTLDRGEEVRSEAGCMLFMDETIEMDTTMQGGFWGSVKRALGGDSFFIPKFKATSHQARVAFAAPYPGGLKVVELRDSEIICQRDSFLCGTGDLEITVAFTKKIGAGFFGGEGFILQKIRGTGTAFLHSGGNLLEYNLAAGQSLKVDTGCLVAFDPTVDYDIQFIGGFKNALFGGEGLFLTRLSGPGKVVLQTLPFSRMADRIISASRGQREESKGIGGIIGGSGGVLGDIFSGDE